MFWFLEEPVPLLRVHEVFERELQGLAKRMLSVNLAVSEANVEHDGEGGRHDEHEAEVGEDGPVLEGVHDAVEVAADALVGNVVDEAAGFHPHPQVDQGKAVPFLQAQKMVEAAAALAEAAPERASGDGQGEQVIKSYHDAHD